MKLIILAAGEGWHVRDLRRAASLEGVEIELRDFRELTASVGGSPPKPGASPPEPGLAAGEAHVLVRSMPGGTLEQVIFRMDVLQRLEAAGTRVVNRPRSLEAAIDKYLCTARMETVGLPVPETFVCEKAGPAVDAFERLGGDAVLKPIFGSEGRGIARLTSIATARVRFAELEAAGSVICIQRFVHHPGHDYRLFTLSDRVLCGMRRVASGEGEGAWITNIARGGKAERLEVTPALASLALRAAHSIDAEVSGVDILPDRDGRLWLLEVNAVPGWRALAPASGVDVGREVVRYVKGTS